MPTPGYRPPWWYRGRHLQTLWGPLLRWFAPPPLRQPLIRFDEEEPIIYRAKLEQQPPGPFPSLLQLIDEKNRKLFVRKIFDRDADAYMDFIQRLESVLTWKEAKSLLDQELQRRKRNPYSKEVIRLSDLVFGRYFSKRS